jgi:hypothetical protein
MAPVRACRREMRTAALEFVGRTDSLISLWLGRTHTVCRALSGAVGFAVGNQHWGGLHSLLLLCRREGQRPASCLMLDTCHVCSCSRGPDHRTAALHAYSIPRYGWLWRLLLLSGSGGFWGRIARQISRTWRAALAPATTVVEVKRSSAEAGFAARAIVCLPADAVPSSLASGVNCCAPVLNGSRCGLLSVGAKVLDDSETPGRRWFIDGDD